jgi:hypothetical protein
MSAQKSHDFAVPFLNQQDYDRFKIGHSLIIEGVY